MKLEIDIPNIIYNDAKENRNYVSLTKLEIAWKAIADGKPLEQEPILDKISAEIAEYGSICVEYKLTDRRDKDIEKLVTDVLKQAKKQVLDVIDKYKAESEEQA